MQYNRHFFSCKATSQQVVVVVGRALVSGVGDTPVWHREASCREQHVCEDKQAMHECPLRKAGLL